jgi:hypothetical protein
MVWTARQACNPPRAATFLSAISAAESLAAAGATSAAAANDAARAIEIKSTGAFRNILRILAARVETNPITE